MQTNRQADRQAGRQTGGQITGRQTNRRGDIQTSRPTDKLTGRRQTDKLTGRQTNRRADHKQAGRQAGTHRQFSHHLSGYRGGQVPVLVQVVVEELLQLHDDRRRLYLVLLPHHLHRHTHVHFAVPAAYSAIRYDTIQYNTIQYNTTQHNTTFGATKMSRLLLLREECFMVQGTPIHAFAPFVR